MPRTLQVTVDSAASDELVDSLREMPGVLGIRLQRGVSVQPPGDVVALDVLDRSLPDVTLLLTERSIRPSSSSSATTSTPLSLVSAEHSLAVAEDISEATWEEMDQIMGRESNMTLNALLVMAVSGSIATIGIAQNALHVVIGAMLIAPGFEPIVRGVLRIVAAGERPLLGWRQLLEAYGALLLGAGATSMVMLLLGSDPRGDASSYLPAGVLIGYWSSITPTGVVVALLAGAAGAVLIASNRSVLTAGVMVALALVPGMTIAAIGLTTLDFGLAAAGAARWLLDVALVAVASALVLSVKRVTVHRRRSMT